MESVTLLEEPTVYRAILSSMGEGIIFAGSDDRLTFINRAAEAIRGISAQNYLGRSLLAIHSSQSAQRIKLLLEKLKSGEMDRSKRVIQVRGKFFENSYYPIREGDVYVGTLLVSRDITEKERLKEENTTLKRQITTGHPVGDLIGRSPAMQPVFEMIRATAGLDSTILVTGESGTGKELVARAIHDLSCRVQQPLIRINCAALPETLLEAELFGHERGAFTGAVRERKGKFEQAHTGTIFLDEIGEIPLQSQAKLLRAIQEKAIERIGGAREISVDVRIIAATNRDLKREVEAGRFRSDLFYRLNVIPIHIPPLRERSEDILPLATFFLSRFAEKMNKEVKGISEEAMKALLAHSYPGNVRELENALERGVALSKGDLLALEDLPPDVAAVVPSSAPQVSSLSVPLPSPLAAESNASLADATSEYEKRLIVEALLVTGNRKGEAAKRLRISRKTLWEKMKQMEIS